MFQTITHCLLNQAIVGCHAVHTRQTKIYNHWSVEYGLFPSGTDGCLVCFAGLNEFSDLFSIIPSKITISAIGTLNTNALLAVHDLQINEPISALAGYSLGGVYAIYYSLVHRLQVPVITFGTPRCVGLDTKVMLRPSNIQQYCIKDDPVTHSPLVGGWYHPTCPKVIDHINGKWVLLSSTQFWQDSLSELSLGGYYNSFLAVLYLLIKSALQRNSRHAIDTYLEALTSLFPV